MLLRWAFLFIFNLKIFLYYLHWYIVRTLKTGFIVRSILKSIHVHFRTCMSYCHHVVSSFSTSLEFIWQIYVNQYRPYMDVIVISPLVVPIQQYVWQSCHPYILLKSHLTLVPLYWSRTDICMRDLWKTPLQVTCGWHYVAVQWKLR